jgi:hypothetical protein
MARQIPEGRVQQTRRGEGGEGCASGPFFSAPRTCSIPACAFAKLSHEARHCCSMKAGLRKHSPSLTQGAQSW